MDSDTICFICQDFKANVGHETKWCPKNICQKCGQNGHTKIGCMVNFENLPLPNEILLKIFSYLNEQDLEKCSKVSERFKIISDELVNQRNQFEKKNPHVLTQRLVLILHSHCCMQKEKKAIDSGRPVLQVGIYLIFRQVSQN